MTRASAADGAKVTAVAAMPAAAAIAQSAGVTNEANGTSSSSSKAATFSARVTGTIAVPGDRGFLAMAVGSGGQLWVTQEGDPAQRPVVGHLLRVDAASGKVALDRPVGGFPGAVAFSGSYVWVVNGIGDGKTPEAGANTVVQIAPATGAVMHRYQINQPYGVAASGDAAWVAAAGDGDVTRIVRLDGKAGTVEPATTLRGTAQSVGAPDIVVGPGAVYVVVLVAEPGQPARDVVYRLDGATDQISAQRTLPTVGTASLAYGDGVVFVAVATVQAGGVYQLDGRTLGLARTVTTEAARAITTANGHLWALFNNGGSRPTAVLAPYAMASGRLVAPPVALPAGDPNLLAADNARVWVAPEGRYEVVEVAPS